MASSNGSHSTVLTPARSASTGGVRVFNVGDALPLSTDQRQALKNVLARIIEHYPPAAADTCTAAARSRNADDTAH